MMAAPVVAPATPTATVKTRRREILSVSVIFAVLSCQINERADHENFCAVLSLIWSKRIPAASRQNMRRGRDVGYECSVERRQISGHRADLCIRQIMRDGLHDRGVVRIALVLAAFLVPVRQLLVEVVVKLSRQARKCVAPLGVIAVTGGTGRHVGFLDAFEKDLLSLVHVAVGCAVEWLRVELGKLLRESFLHRRREHMGDVEHHRVAAPPFDEGLQLVEEIFGLLPGKPWHRVRAAEALALGAMTGLAIVELGLELGRRNVSLAALTFVVALVLGLRHRACRQEYDYRKQYR